MAETQPHDDGLDAGPRMVLGAGAERFCAATGVVRPVADMIRFVVAPDGTVVPDLRRRLPGRGLWITATRKALGTALSRKAFARGFKRDIRVAQDFVASTERLLERAALDALAMAHKARMVKIGFAKTEAALERDRIVALLHASDAAPDGVRKLAGVLHRCMDDQPNGVMIIDTFTSAQLDLALGRSNVIHAALLAGPGSETFVRRATRLDHFRAGDRSDSAGT
jgi:predicted RNA-binding protein YlxR (DUF448 family)